MESHSLYTDGFFMFIKCLIINIMLNSHTKQAETMAKLIRKIFLIGYLRILSKIYGSSNEFVRGINMNTVFVQIRGKQYSL